MAPKMSQVALKRFTESRRVFDERRTEVGMNSLPRRKDLPRLKRRRLSYGRQLPLSAHRLRIEPIGVPIDRVGSETTEVQLLSEQQVADVFDYRPLTTRRTQARHGSLHASERGSKICLLLLDFSE
jgi:hypothetical protein